MNIDNYLALRRFSDGLLDDGFSYMDLALIILSEIHVDRIQEIINNKGEGKEILAKHKKGE